MTRTNDTPHSINQKVGTWPKDQRGRPTAPLVNKPKKKAIPMSEKVTSLCEVLKRDNGQVLRTGKRFSNATTGKPISSAVVKAAIKDGKLKDADPGGLFGDQTPDLMGQTLILAG